MLIAYESVGMGFDALVQQYAALMAEIDNKKWALSELRQTQDDDLGDLWNQRWSGTAVPLLLFDPWTDVCKIDFGITSKKQMTYPKIPAVVIRPVNWRVWSRLWYYEQEANDKSKDMSSNLDDKNFYQ